MKRNHYLLILFLTGIMLTSCKKSNMEYENDYEKSYNSWTSFKTSSNNSYRYQVLTSSWIGSSSETIVVVKEGKVIQRSYVYKTIEQSPKHEITIREEWTEDEKSLNTHNNGSATITLDDIYQTAKNTWLLKRGKDKTVFESKNNGMISTCGYSPDNCQDDCFIGISIGFIEKL